MEETFAESIGPFQGAGVVLNPTSDTHRGGHG
jgi:hypothetical protein